MEPFKITCVTCRARLSVRDASTIGQILACPRCGSMVQVAAPSPGRAGESDAKTATTVSAVTATAVTATQIEAPPPAVAAGGHIAPIAGSGRTASDTFADVADFGAELGVQSASLPLAPRSRDSQTASPNPSTAASSARTIYGMSAAKLAAVVTGCALAGSALVITALSWGPSDREEAPHAAPTVHPSATIAAQPTDVEAADGPRVDTTANGAADAAASDVVEVGVAHEVDGVPDSPLTADADRDALEDENPFALPPGDAASATADAAPNDPPPVPSPPGTPATAPEVEPAATVAAEAPAADEAPTTEPRLRIDPLEFDPEGLDLATLLRGDAADPLAMSELEPPEPHELAASEAPAEDAADEPVADDLPADEAPGAWLPAPPAAPAVLLARKFPAVKVERMPLAVFLDFATSLSALPVSVTPDELRLAAVSAATPVSVDVTDATIEQLLTAGLKPLRLRPAVEGPQIVLRRTLGDQPRDLAYPVDDLVDGDARQLGGWVQDLVAPESWRARGGSGELTVDGQTLRIRQSERVGYETILFLERYRAARGLAARSRYPAALLAAWADAAVMNERLAAPVTFNFSRPTALREAFRWWQVELGEAVLVDWPALGDLRAWPHTPLRASATALPWSEALTAALEPLGLGWRVVDGRTIEITSRQRVEGELVLEMYRVGDAANLDPAQLLADAAAPPEAHDAEHHANAPADATASVAHLDAEHRVLLVRAPASVQRRLAARLAAAGLLAGAGG